MAAISLDLNATFHMTFIEINVHYLQLLCWKLFPGEDLRMKMAVSKNILNMDLDLNFSKFSKDITTIIAESAIAMFK